MKLFKVSSDILNEIYDSIKNANIKDLDGKDLKIEILDINTMETTSPFQTPILFITKTIFQGERLQSDQTLLKIPDTIKFNLNLMHYHINWSHLREIIDDLGDKILGVLKNYDSELILDKSIDIEVIYNTRNESFFGVINFILTIQLNLSKIEI
ncbi:MAG TPA: hypothetical protein PLK41_04585 [Defluviitoga tunisiensis]|nr:hypothetical protein [bacterium]HPP10248.1 hypothetical protein [Defluviitoga tunisiensis]